MRTCLGAAKFLFQGHFFIDGGRDYFGQGVKGGVLIITRNFPPFVGGMEQLIYHCATETSQGFATAVVGPPGGKSFVNENIDYISARVDKPLIRSFLSFFAHAFRRGFQQRPKVIFCGSGLMSPVGFLCARLIGAKCVVYLHGLDIVVDNCFYQHIFMPLIRRCDLVLVNSDSSYQSALERHVPERRLTKLYPGTDVPGYHPQRAEAFRAIYGLSNQPTLIYVGRITKRKGLLEFAESCALPLVKKFPDLRILVVGDDARYSIAADQPIVAKLRDYIERNALERHFIFCGEITTREILSQAYWSANLLVFPVHHIPNDIEGFGMVAIEAAAHGVPTVAFRVGGLENSVDDSRSGILVDYPNYHAFADAIIDILERKKICDWESCVAHGRRYAWSKFGGRLRSMISTLMV